MFEYFRANQNEAYIFLQLPVMLIKDPIFKDLSSDSKLLYSLLLNRTSLSTKNGWADNEGKIYIIYTVKEIMEDLNCSDKKATKSMTELRNIGLVDVKRQGLNKPNLIYVKNFATHLKYTPDNKKEDTTPDDKGTRKKYDSGIVKNTIQDSAKIRSINNNINNIENIKNPIQSYQIKKDEPKETDTIRLDMMVSESQLKKGQKKEGPHNTFTHHSDSYLEPTISKYNYTEILEIVKRNIEYNFLISNSGYQKALVDEILDVIVDTICNNYKDGYIQMRNELVYAESVKSVFFKLNSGHIEYFIDCFNRQTEPITKLKPYIRKSLFDNYRTINHHYTNRVNVDMPQFATPKIKSGNDYLRYAE